MAACSPRGTASTAGDSPQPSPARKKADHRVVLFLGEGYTARAEVLAAAAREYGLVSEGGLLEVIRYPEDTLVSGRVRLSLVRDLLNAEDISALVALAPPELLGRQLAESGVLGVRPSVSILPEGDALVAQAGYTLVVDLASTAEVLTDEQSLTLSDADLSFLVCTAVTAVEKFQSGDQPVDMLVTALNGSARMADRKKDTWAPVPQYYTDPGTGLRARNHLLVELTGAAL